MTKVLIFGAGGVGCIYGYILDRGGAKVTAVCRTNYEAAKADGIWIRSKLWGNVHYRPAVVLAVTEAKGPFDFVLVCSKAFPGTSKMIEAAVSERTTIVLAQNGIGIEEEYAELYPNNTIISGVVWLPTTQVEPGIVEHGPLQCFEIGTFPANASSTAKAQAQSLSDLFAAGGASCPVFDDIQTKRWPKLAVNTAWNPVTALSLCDDANFLRSSSVADETIVKIMRQAGDVARAAGYPQVTEEWIQDALKLQRGRIDSGGKEPSMLTDIRNGRALEVEAILGNTIRIAKKLGVDAPYLELLYALVKGLNFSTVRNDEWKPLLKFN